MTNSIICLQVNGKRGYFPKKFLLESKILHSNLEHIVPTSEIPTNQSGSDTPAYDIIDGTTITLNDDKPTALLHDLIDPHVVEPEWKTVSIKDNDDNVQIKDDFPNSLDVTQQIESSEEDIQTAHMLEDSGNIIQAEESKETLKNDAHLLDEKEIQSNNVSSTANGIHVTVKKSNDDSQSINEMKETSENDLNQSDQVQSENVSNVTNVIDVVIAETEEPFIATDTLMEESIESQDDSEEIDVFKPETPQLIMAPNIPLESDTLNITLDAVQSEMQSEVSIENDTDANTENNENVDIVDTTINPENNSIYDKPQMTSIEAIQNDSNPTNGYKEIHPGNLPSNMIHD